MNRRSLLEASSVALAMLVAWWGGVLYLDGVLAAKLPYGQYEAVALLYPDVFYPGVPGMALAEVLFFLNVHVVLGGLTFYVALLGWTILLSVAIGAGAVRYASGRDRSPTVTAAAAVVALFVAVTVIEAAVTLVA